MKTIRVYAKKICCLLTAALLLLCCLPLAAFAEEAQEEQGSPAVGFTDVAVLVKAYNLQLQNNELSLLNLISNDKLGDMLANLAASAKMIGSAGSAMQAAVSKVLGDELGTGLTSTFQTDTMSMLSQAASMNPTPLQIDLVKLQLEQVGLQVQQGAEALYYNMIKLSDNLEKARRSRPLLEQALTLAETAHAVGMGTEAAALQAKLGLSDLDAAISGLALHETVLTYEMNKLLGRDFDRALELQPLPEADLAYYDAIDLEKDLKEAVKTNFALRALQREREGISGDEYDATAREKKMKDNEIEMQTQALKASFTLLYHTIADDRVKLDNERVRLQLAQYDAETAEAGFASGQISEMALKQAREALASQQDAVTAAEQTLFWNIRRYQWGMQGLPVGE